jgi:hypothetical protein
MTTTGWWDRKRAEADGAMAAQRTRLREIQEHPPSFVGVVNAHPWIVRVLGALLIAGEIAVGAIVTALVTILALAALYLWRWVNRSSH